MAASRALQRAWHDASEVQLASVLRHARDSVQAFTDATAASGSLLQGWIAGREVLEYEHYPPDDLVDAHSGSQFYYHAHRSGELEHGHLHLFWHATSTGRRRRFRDGQRRWVRTAPTHLFAVSLDARGLPVALFTVNRWVTGGHWFDAATTMAMVERFTPAAVDGHEDSCRWLRGFVRLYHPAIAELLVQRDRRLARRRDARQALDDRRLEILSVAPIDWARDTDALERIAASRNLGLQ